MPSLTRRRLLASGCALVTAVAGYASLEASVGPTPTLSTRSPASGEWPTDRRGPARRAAVPDASPPESDPTVDWEVDVGPVDPNVSIVVADGDVAVATGRRVRVRDAATGDPRWSASVGGLGLNHQGDAVYCTDGRAVVALDPGDGDRRWRTPVDAAVADLLVAESSVVVATETDVRALDPVEGDRRWRRGIAGGRYASLSAADGTLYVARPGEVLALGPRRGWDAIDKDGLATTNRAGLDGALLAPALTGDGRAVVGSHTFDEGGAVAAFDVEGLTERWRADEFGVDTVSTPAVADGAGVARTWSSEREAGDLVGLDLTDGELLWSREDLLGDRAFTDPVIAGDLAFVERGNGDGEVLAVDPASGDLRWSVVLDDAVGDEAVYGLTPAGERVFVVTWDGRLLCLR